MRVTRSKSGPQRQKDRTAPVVKTPKRAASVRTASGGTVRPQGSSQGMGSVDPGPGGNEGDG